MNTPLFRLVMRTGPTPGQSFELVKSEIYIGRDITNDIVINDSEVSRRHARLIYEAGRYVIQDLGSTNGTFVNGQRLLGPHALSVGEAVMIGGNVMLMFESTQFDPGATVVGSTPQAVSSPYPSQRPAPAYAPLPPAPAVQTPLGPEEVAPAPAPKKRELNTWVLAGCGCLFLLAIACVAAAFIIDYLQLWCQLFGFLIPGC